MHIEGEVIEGFGRCENASGNLSRRRGAEIKVTIS